MYAEGIVISSSEIDDSTTKSGDGTRGYFKPPGYADNLVVSPGSVYLAPHNAWLLKTAANKMVVRQRLLTGFFPQDDRLIRLGDHSIEKLA